MKVLMITGDRRFGPGHPRYELQRAALQDLQVVYWGRGALWPTIPKEKFDVVTVQDPFWRGFFGWIVAKRLHSKLNVQVHTDLSVQRFPAHVIAQIVLRHADSVRVVSQKLKEQVLGYSVRAPIHILPIYIDIMIYHNVKKEPHERKTILWLGRFEPEKNPLEALDVLKRVRKVVDARLILLGSGSLEHQLRSSVGGLPVEFPGWRDSKKYLAGADVVLSTSLHESFGASFIEALAAGVPVVAPDVGIAKEAGARVVPYEQLAHEVTEVLQSGVQGELKLTLLDSARWSAAFRQTLT